MDDQQAQLLLMRGQMNAMNALLLALVQADPTWQSTLRSGVDIALKEVLDSGDEERRLVALGMRSYLHETLASFGI